MYCWILTRDIWQTHCRWNVFINERLNVFQFFIQILGEVLDALFNLSKVIVSVGVVISDGLLNGANSRAETVSGVNYLVRSATTMMAGWVVLLFTLSSLLKLLLSSVAFPL